MKIRMALSSLVCFGLSHQAGLALPTMIRLGYPTCSSCHISPQGGGLLNLYGHGIDRAQSLFGGEYTPSQQRLIEFLNAEGRITQDYRVVLQQQDISTAGKRGSQLFRSRFLYRNATELGKGFRFTGTVMGENLSAPRPSLTYEPAVNPAQTFVTTALLSYRASGNFEVAAGRDMLPTGVNISDLSTFIRARNRLGYYDAPTQAKVFWRHRRFQATPYAYAPGGNEKSGQHESGAGGLAEFGLWPNNRMVIGVNALHGTARDEDRTMIGPYARLGFGRWGILAEHDMTDRAMKSGSPVSFWQSASYGQIFWAAREWLVPSFIVERLRVDRPHLEQLDAAKIEIAARINGQLTITAGPRLQRDELTGRYAKSVVFQVAMKTVH